MINNRHNISFQHVYSHSGGSSPEEVGNDQADHLANHFRIRGKKTAPSPYLSNFEEAFSFVHGAIRIQSDPRVYLKRLELQYLARKWKTMAPRQAEWFIKFPTQIINQSKRVWKWSVESGNGKAWLYFIFAICQWLPTNDRFNHDDAFKRQCHLCLTGAKDGLAHILVCPALSAENSLFKETAFSRIAYWNLPFSSRTSISREYKFREQCRNIAMTHFVPAQFRVLRIELLAKRFWSANSHKQCISTAQFLNSVSNLWERREKVRDLPHPLSVPFHPCDRLLALLLREFALNAHVEVDPLHVSPLFLDWFSSCHEDSQFGAKPLDTLLNCNGFCFVAVGLVSNGLKLLQRLNDRMALCSGPMRFIVLAPSGLQLPNSFLEILRFPSGSPLFIDVDRVPCPSSGEMSVYLLSNKESMLIDPINWPRFVDSISLEFDSVIINTHADALFRERSALDHAPRVLSRTESIGPQCKLYTFYDASSPADPIKAKSLNLPPHLAKLIDKVNQHNPCLSVLGILPNQLRRILKLAKYPDPQEVLTDISRTLFFAGFRVWSRRQFLAKQYWKSAAPENRQLNSKKKRGRVHQIEEKVAQSKCKNPFHFLKRHANLSQQRPNRCPCSHVDYIALPSRSRNIRDFILKFPSPILHNSENISFFISQDDAIRREHDRGKKRRKVGSNRIF